MAYEKLTTLIQPDEFAQDIELGSLTIRSKPFSDYEALYPSCPRCFSQNPLINPGGGDKCTSCGHAFVRSCISFEVLPLVEFLPDGNIPLHRVKKLLECVPDERVQEAKPKKKKDGWEEDYTGETNILRQDGLEEEQETPFMQKIMETCEFQMAGDAQKPVIVDEDVLASLKTEEV